jgi:putative transposase
VPFLADERNRALLGSRRGESDLIYRDNEWSFYATCDIAEAPLTAAVDFLGVDVGVVTITVDSSGSIYSGAALRGLRHRQRHLRAKSASNKAGMVL